MHISPFSSKLNLNVECRGKVLIEHLILYEMFILDALSDLIPEFYFAQSGQMYLLFLLQ